MLVIVPFERVRFQLGTEHPLYDVEWTRMRDRRRLRHDRKCGRCVIACGRLRGAMCDIVVVQLLVIDVMIPSFAKMALSKTLLINVEMN